MKDFDRLAAAMALWRMLGRGDMVRFMDQAMLEYYDAYGSSAPIPALEDMKEDARFWADNSMPDALAVYLVAIFKALPEGRQKAALKHITGMVEDTKAEPHSG